MRQSILLLVVLFGCTSSDDDGNHIDLVSTPYTLQPGEEKYFCYTMRLPADRDIAITKMTPTYGEATHHILVAEADEHILGRREAQALLGFGQEPGGGAAPAGHAIGFLVGERRQDPLVGGHGRGRYRRHQPRPLPVLPEDEEATDPPSFNL